VRAAAFVVVLVEPIVKFDVNDSTTLQRARRTVLFRDALGWNDDDEEQQEPW
jgi:hypothetical protein